MTARSMYQPYYLVTGEILAAAVRNLYPLIQRNLGYWILADHIILDRGIQPAVETTEITSHRAVGNRLILKVFYKPEAVFFGDIFHGHAVATV